MTPLLALLVLAAAPVDVDLTVKKPLKLTRRGELKGVLEVRITNRGTEPITLQHRDVHGFRFEPVGGDAGTQVLFHSCDCGFELGIDKPPDKRTFTLRPQEHRIITFEDFECDGGPYHPPPPGKYRVTWSLGEPAPTPKVSAMLDLDKCGSLVHTRPAQPFESRAVSVDLRP
ncbi:MAG: hypothetical protein JNK82_28905 [Myxococcaceae bacterium]|nr:hypothetical protein [Myxococcaceae bacterium]